MGCIISQVMTNPESDTFEVINFSIVSDSPHAFTLSHFLSFGEQNNAMKGAADHEKNEESRGISSCQI
jgi:hypothetical protein